MRLRGGEADIGSGRSRSREPDAYPAMPEDGYGWEKLFSERMCRHFSEDFGLLTRVARYHNVYGPYGTYDGGREKAPAAVCRKIIARPARRAPAKSKSGVTASRRAASRSSTTAIDGTLRLMESDVAEPLNIGSDQLVTINQLVDIVGAHRRRRRLTRSYKLDAPKGVRGRNSDNTLITTAARLGASPPRRRDATDLRVTGFTGKLAADVPRDGALA